MTGRQRRHYRVTGEDLEGILVSMLFGSNDHAVHLLDISVAGAAIAFIGWDPTQFNAVAHKHRANTSIRIRAQSLQEPLDIACQVVHVRQVSAGLVCGLAFRQPIDEIVNLDQALLKVFNRRGAVRVEADPAMPVSVGLLDHLGTQIGHGMMRDLSLTGIGVTVPLETLQSLQGVEPLWVSFVLDGHDLSLPVELRFARRVNATQTSDVVPVNTAILGIEFDVDARNDNTTNRRLANWVMRRQREIQRMKQLVEDQLFEA